MSTKTLQSSLRKLATAHREELSKLSDDANAKATKLFRGLADEHGKEGVWDELLNGVQYLLQSARVAAKDAATRHFQGELAVALGRENAKSVAKEVSAGNDPKPEDVGRYVDNAIQFPRVAVESVTEEERGAKFADCANFAHVVIESEATEAYRKAREALNESLSAIPADEAEKLGFKIATKQEDLRAFDASELELREDKQSIALVGERWDARADACEKCRGAHGEIRPMGFGFSQPGPTVHARCQCVRTLWAVMIPWEQEGRAALGASAGTDTTMNIDTTPQTGPTIQTRQLAWMDIAIDTRELKVDEATRTISDCVASDESIDSHGSKIIAKGWKLDRFIKNPVLMWNHAASRYSSPAKPEDVLGSCENPRVKWKMLLVDLRFDTKEINEQAEQVFRQMLAKTIRSLSVGFWPLRYHYESQGEGQRELLVIDEAELIEVSVLPIGSNENALSSLREMCPPLDSCCRAEQPKQDSTPAITLAEKAACASTQQERSLMDKTILEVLGLKAEAPETDVLATVTRNRDQIATILSLTGADSFDAAVGTVRALQAASKNVPELERQIAELKSAEVARERDALLRDNAAKFTPAEMEGWVKDASLEGLKAFVRTAPDRVKTEPTPEPAQKDAIEVTQEDRVIMSKLGIDEKAYREMKRELNK